MGRDASLWLVFFVVGGLTFGLRLSFIALLGRVAMPGWLQRGLRFVPVSALTAIFAPALLMPKGPLDISLGNARLLAGILAILVAWRTKNMLLTIAVGMAALLLLQLVVR